MVELESVKVRSSVMLYGYKTNSLIFSVFYDLTCFRMLCLLNFVYYSQQVRVDILIDLEPAFAK